MAAARAVRNHALAEAKSAVRLAVLAADQVFVPASSYFESSQCREVIDSFETLFDRGALFLVGTGSSVEEYAHAKLRQYLPGSVQHRAYASFLRDPWPHPPFRTKTQSTTGDIIESWREVLASPGFPDAFLGRGVNLPKDLEARWDQVPERLEEMAFIVDYVEPMLFDEADPVLHNRLHSIINEGYFESYAQELDAGLVVDMVYLASRHALRSGTLDLPYRTLREALRRRGTLQAVRTASPPALVDLREDPVVTQCLGEALAARARETRSDDLPVQLPSSSDLEALLSDVIQVAPGAEGWHQYQVAATALLTALFRESLSLVRAEQGIDGGRKRVDILFRNIARDGFFWWVEARRVFGGTPYIACECKNYEMELGNPEVDQMTGRFAWWRGRVGLLLCRRVQNKALLLERCRDAAVSGRGWVIPLEDEDLRELVRLGADPRWKPPPSGYGQSDYLADKLVEIDAGA